MFTFKTAFLASFNVQNAKFSPIGKAIVGPSLLKTMYTFPSGCQFGRKSSLPKEILVAPLNKTLISYIQNVNMF